MESVVEILFKQESYRIVGACFEVYNEMGCGYLEQVYQECLEIEFAEMQIPFVAQQQLKLNYKNHCLKSMYVPDAICNEQIIVELKAVKELSDEHRAQVHNYLKGTGFRLGLLVNFGHYPKLQHERIVR